MDLVGVRKREKGSFLNLSAYSIITYSNKTYLTGLLVLNAVVYLAAVKFFPGFSSDDYYIFSLISNDPSKPFPVNIHEIFFLFVRPVSYFSFWTDFHLFTGNPFLMKAHSVLLHLAVLATLYFLLVSAAELFNKKTEKRFVFLLLVLFSVHPDILAYILFINNRTELLALLFYSSSLLVLVRFLLEKISAYQFAVLFTGMFLLSALSKQNGLHLGFLVVLLALILKTTPRQKRVIIHTSIPLILFSIYYSCLNYKLIMQDSFDLEYLWRKPFSASGTLLFTSVPIIAQDLYRFFFHHKIAAIITSGALLSNAACFIRTHKIDKSKILPAALFLAIIFYPRIFAEGGARINTHLWMWFILMLFLILLNKKFSGRYLFIYSYIVLIVISSLQLYLNTIKTHKKSEELSLSLRQIESEEQDKNIFIAVAPDAAFSYEYNYLTKGKYGPSHLAGFPVVCKPLLPGFGINEKAVQCTREGNIIYAAAEQEFCLGENPVNRMLHQYDVRKTGQPDREYKKYSIQLPEGAVKRNIFLFFNGISWERIE